MAVLETHPPAGDARPLALVVRFIGAFLVLFLVVVAQWPDEPPPDFQAWLAASEVAADGQNPYEGEALNAELQSDPAYGGYWQDAPDEYVMRFFNPPMWLAILAAMAFDPLVMSAVGVALVAGSMSYLSRGVESVTFVGYVIVGAAVSCSPIGLSTVAFGQTGLLLAGLLGLRLSLLDRGLEGIPLALLSFKPHLALAAALPALAKHPRTLLLRLTPPAVLLVLASVALFGVSMFVWWVQATGSDHGSVVPVVDMTLRTLFPRWPLPSYLSVPMVLLAAVIIVVISLRTTSAKPATLVLLSVAFMTFLSGHGFEHDWVWMMLIPVVHRWSIVQSVVGAIGLIAVHSLTFATNPVEPYPLIWSPGIAALAVIGYLAFELLRPDSDQESGIHHASEAVEVG